MDKFIRIDMSTGKVTITPVPEEYKMFGGRGLTSSIVAREVDPHAHP
jgi:aldehyde:ferredoxin oxidoreductase